MIGEINAVYISVGSIVLDRPDQTGACIAKDFASGWAYIIADGDGDKRFRGTGACAGGLTTGLRYAFLSAVDCVPESRRITIYVDTPQVHRQMVQLATTDAQVVAAIGRRLVYVMTRPQERSLYQVRLAAERAAAAALRAREHAEIKQAVETAVSDTVETEAEPEQTAANPDPAYLARQSWREKWGGHSGRRQYTVGTPAQSARQAMTTPTPLAPPTSPSAEAAALRQVTVPGTRALTRLMREIDLRVASVQSSLQSVG